MLGRVERRVLSDRLSQARAPGGAAWGVREYALPARPQGLVGLLGTG